jgi:hypothetical protein
MSHHNSVAIPSHIAASLPNLDLLRQVLPHHVIEMPARFPLVRAAWNKASVWPEKVNRTYRYGPVKSLMTVDGFPFHWIYAAEETLTAIWEAQLCTNPITFPGRFTLQQNAETALIADLSFEQPLRLFDLSGAAVSRLGIYDQLRNPDYEWCQWFGVQMDQVISEQNEKVHGFVYPSRRHPGAPAYAISSRVYEELAQGLMFNVTEFRETEEYLELLNHPCFIERKML